MTTTVENGGHAVLRCRISCGWNRWLSTVRLSTEFRPHLYNELRHGYPQSLCTDHWSPFLPIKPWFFCTC